jgi:ABC-type dipeptide/oligopeptide/nickel transport system permease subunit
MNTATTRTTWRRLKKNKGALIGIAIIALAILVAIFAYWLAPDGSPNANRMVVEIGGQRPGYTQQFLQLPHQGKSFSLDFSNGLLGGEYDKFQYIPITSYQQQGDSLIIQKYVDEGVTERMALPISRTRWHDGKATGDFKIITQKFLLGTDKYGRDILSRLLIGVRVSLGVGLVTLLISLSIGVMLGAMAGYFRGRTDNVIMWFINVIWSIPTLLLVFAITLVLGKGFWQVFIAIGLTMWVSVARIIRGQVLSVRELEYVEAAKALGYSHTRIVLRHVLPNVMGPVMVVAASNFASAIVIEAGLTWGFNHRNQAGD